MKLGFVSAILPELTFEQIIDQAAEHHYRCVEICCWPAGKAERRYAGVTHIDVDQLNEERKRQIVEYTQARQVEISALGYYPNPLDPDLSKREIYHDHLRKLMDAAAFLGIGQVNTFIGRDKTKSIDENFKLFAEVWPSLIEYAENRQVRVGIENCPMLFTGDEWPGGNNLAVSPAIWRRMFREIESNFFGLNFDPSHLLWMQMDYVKPVYEFADKLFHIHLKDAKIFRDCLDDVGILAHPLEYHTPKLVGLGDIDWSRFLSAVYDIGYQGALCVEVEDKAFEKTLESRQNSLAVCKRYLDQFV